MDVNEIRRLVLKTLKLNGFAVKAEAAAWLADQLTATQDVHHWISKVLDKLQTLNIDDVAVDVEHVKKCLTECTSERSSSETVFSVISAFEVPLFRYDPEKNKFFRDDIMEKERRLLPDAKMKSYVFKRRYAYILQQVKRISIFKSQSLGRRQEVSAELSTAERFLCNSNKIKQAFMLGMLVNRGGGHYELEDPTGSIKLDLSQCTFNAGLFVEHCFCLVEGSFEDGVLHAAKFAMPLPEKAEESFVYFNNQNTFGGPSETSLRLSKRLRTVQIENEGATIVFLSDVWLDDQRVLAKLKKLFDGLGEAPPVAFVLFGNFLQQQTGPHYAARLKTAFGELADMIAAVPSLCRYSHFVLIPGPNDPGSPLVYPRAGLMDFLTGSLRQKVPHLTLATNPCRIQYCNRELVCMRADLVTKMCRNAVYFPTDDQLPMHFTRTILSNGTLSPMSLYTLPTYWGYSNALDLYPLPNLVVVADKLNAFITELKGCHVVNPGSLARSGFNIYLPHSDEVETSYIPNDE